MKDFLEILKIVGVVYGLAIGWFIGDSFTHFTRDWIKSIAIEAVEEKGICK